MMARWIREPLVHFALVAAAIFAAWQIAGAGEAPRDTIQVSEAELERLAALYTAESGTLPGPEDMRAIVADQVRTQALAREARRLGLDEEDVIVERRLAQKMEFMVADLAEIDPPTDAVLQAWYEENASSFGSPARISFQHVFLGDDPSEAEALLAGLSGETPPEWRRLGQPFMLQSAYGEVPLREVQRLFGADFARALAGTHAGSGWQGPVQSAFGQHLVNVTARTEAALPPFEAVRSAVEADWRDAERRRSNEAAIADIIARYEVIVDTE